MSDKIAKLTKVAGVPPSDADTYEELIKNHLSKLTLEQKQMRPDSLVICGMNNDRSVYSIVEGAGTANVVGMIEMVKQCIMLDMLGE